MDLPDLGRVVVLFGVREEALLYLGLRGEHATDGLRARRVSRGGEGPESPGFFGLVGF